jgi:hypothetical protein
MCRQKRDINYKTANSTIYAQQYRQEIHGTLGWNNAVHVTCVLLKVRKLNYVSRMQNDNQLGMLVKTVASCEAGGLRIVINFPKLNH